MNIKLYEAITQNDQLLLKQLLDEEGDSILDEKTAILQETTLHLACRYGHANIVRQIVDLRPNLVEALDEKKETSIMDACRGGSLEVLEILLQAKPWVFHQSNKSALILACEYGHGHLLKRMMKEINSLDNFSLSLSFAAHFSCLRIPVSRGYEEFIRELIQVCPSLMDGSDDDRLNLLHYACQYGEADIARMLLILNPNHLAKSYDNYGFAPLHHAVMRNKTVIFKEFKAFAPFAFTVLTKKKETVFHLAVQNNLVDAFISLIQVIGEFNGLFNKGDREGNHLLHLAVHHKSIKIAEYLIDKATENQLQTRNNAGLTALDILLKSGPDDDVALHLKQLFIEKLPKTYFNTKSTSNDEISQRVEEVTFELDKVAQSRKSSSTSSSSGSAHQLRKLKASGSYEIPLYKVAKKILTTIKAAKGDRKDRQKKRMHEMHIEGLQNARNTINIIAILIATVTFTGCLSPPGGFFSRRS